jgi:hypothetical protein
LGKAPYVQMSSNFCAKGVAARPAGLSYPRERIVRLGARLSAQCN